MKQIFLLACGFSLAALAGCNNTGTINDASGNTASSNTASTSGSGTSGATKLNIAVIPKGTTHEFWKSVQAGALKAGKELNVNIQWKGPLKESDRAGQIGIVEQFVSEGTSAIVLAPLDDVALVKPVRSAAAKKIPVIVIDSGIKATAGKDYQSLVATDNYQGGVLAGERMVKLLGGKGKVMMLRYAEGSDSTKKREEGFLSAVKKATGIQIISDNRYAGATMGEAKDSAMQMVDTLKEADGIYTPNESSTMGMLLALRQNQMAGKKKFVGFDTSAPLLEGIGKGEVDALIAQNPVKMGYEGVKAAVAAVKGEKVLPVMDTGAEVVDKANMGTPAIKAIIG